MVSALTRLEKLQFYTILGELDVPLVLYGSSSGIEIPAQVIHTLSNPSNLEALRSKFDDLIQREETSSAESEELLDTIIPDDEPDCPADGSQIQVLVVDDNEINVHYFERVLKRHGFSYATARNGQLALEALEKDSYHLVLMDVHMPVLDGL